MIEGDLYYIMWSSRGLESALNFTQHEKQLVVDILLEKSDAKLIGNPVRGMIVEAVLHRERQYEIWQVYSPLTEDEIVFAFADNPESLKQEIREAGELIYAS